MQGIYTTLPFSLQIHISTFQKHIETFSPTPRAPPP